MPHCSDRLTVKFRIWDEARVAVLASRVGADIGHLFAVIRTAEFLVDEGQVDAAIESVLADASVESASRVSRGTPGCWRIGTGESSGYWGPFQGQLRRMRVYGAWEHSRGGATPLGHIDTGLVAGTPEFTGKNIVARNVLTGSSSIEPTPGPFTAWYHGTDTGSVLFGNGGPAGDNLYGVAPDATNIVHALYSLGDDKDTSADWTAALLWVFSQGVRVISASSYFYNNDQAMHDACDYVAANGGIIVVCAGNESWDLDAAPLYPCVWDSVISVGGAILTDEAWGVDWRVRFQSKKYGSAYGSLVDTVAPVGIESAHSAWPVQGTSIAVPLVAGVAQLMIDVNPSLTFAQVKDILRSTADRARPRDDWTFYGYFPSDVGIIDAEWAVLKAKSLSPLHAGEVLPGIRVTGTKSATGHDWGNCSYPHGTATSSLSNGGLDLALHGPVEIELTGFCSSGPVTDVELWINGTQVYHGPPTSKWTGTEFHLTEHRSVLRDVRIIARTATGQVGTRTFDTGTSAVSAVQSASYDVNSLEPYIPRNPRAGRGFVAGTSDGVDSSLSAKVKSATADASVLNRLYRTTTGDAAVALRQLQATTADAAVAARLSQSAAAGAAVQVTVPRTITAGAAVSATGVTSTAQAAALVRDSYVKTASADAAVADHLAQTMTADAAVQMTRAATVTNSTVVVAPVLVAQTLVAGALVQGSHTASVSSDAAVAVPGTVLRGLPTDALIRGSFTAAASADAFVQNQGFGHVEVNVAGDALVMLRSSQAITANAVVGVLQSLSQTATATAYVQTSATRTLDAGAAVMLRRSDATVGDAIILGATLHNLQADASVAGSNVHELAVSACVSDHVHDEVVADGIASPASQVVAGAFITDPSLAPEWDCVLEIEHAIRLNITTPHLRIRR